MPKRGRSPRSAKARPPIPLFSLHRQIQDTRRQVAAAAARVLDSGVYILGPEVERFEKEFAGALGLPYCLGISSGTQALRVALDAVGVRPGDEVVVPAFTFIATASAVSEAGAKPVFADVEPGSLTLDPKSLEARLTPRTKALIAVHLYGGPADMDPILEIAHSSGLKVIEDCAQSHLTEYRGRMTGGLGDVGCFSFYPTKNLGAAGDAGAIVTRREDCYRAAAMLRNLGRLPDQRYRHERIGYNIRLDEVQAAVLRVRLRRLARWTAERRAVAARYRKMLAGLPLTLPPEDAGGNKSTYHLFVVRTPRRDELARHLGALGIASGVYYPIPLHLQPAYADMNHRPGDFPVSEQACREVLALPMYPGLTVAEIDRVGRAVRSFFEA